MYNFCELGPVHSILFSNIKCFQCLLNWRKSNEIFLFSTETVFKFKALKKAAQLAVINSLEKVSFCYPVEPVLIVIWWMQGDDLSNVSACVQQLKYSNANCTFATEFVGLFVLLCGGLRFQTSTRFAIVLWNLEYVTNVWKWNVYFSDGLLVI